MRHRARDIETLICALSGHATPAAAVRTLRPQDAGLGVDLADGRRLARCTRCDAWVHATASDRSSTATEHLPELAELRIPRRGRALRDAVIMRLIACERAFHSIVFGLLTLALLVLDLNLGTVRHTAHRIIVALESSTALPARATVNSLLSKLANLNGATIHLLLALALAYTVIEGAEAVGLWRERRWAEYLTVIATAGFLPLEIKELAARITVIRLGALIVNVAVLVWLLYAKRLFGLRGGARALAEGSAVDAAALFAPPPTPAAVGPQSSI